MIGNIALPIRRINRRHAGFTLIELMVTVILLGTVLAMSAPLGTVVEQFRMDYLNQRLFNSVVLARSESIKRGVDVSMCRSVSGLDCDVGDQNWQAGWITFIDRNGNDSVEPAQNEAVLRTYSALDSSLKLFAPGGRNRLTFLPRGSVAAGGNFQLCLDGRNPGPVRRVHVLLTGRVRTSSATENCP